MKIMLRLWGQLKQAAGVSVISVELDAGAYVEELVKVAAMLNSGKLGELLVDSAGEVRRSNLVFVYGAQRSLSFELSDGMEVTLMSPIAGG